VAPNNVELVRRGLDAFNRADVDALMELCSDDVVFLPARSALYGGYRGEEGLRRFFADNADTFEVFSVHYDEIHAAGDQLVAIGSLRLRHLAAALKRTSRRPPSSRSQQGNA
jgi:ketosteroid isomerase-like protein